MISYIVRLDLGKEVNFLEYELLNKAMEQSGFSTTIKAEGGKSFHLPLGEYYLFSHQESSEILEKIKYSIKFTNKTVSIVVIRVREVIWDGLNEKIDE